MSLSAGNVDSVRVVIHSPDSVPFLVDKGINLEPGKSTAISLMMKTYERLGSPYEKCQEKDSFTLDSRTFLTTSNVCREKCIVEAIRKNCNCTSTLFEDLTISDHDYCLTFHDNDSSIALNNRSYCELQFMRSLKDLNCEHCVWDCSEIDYDKEIAFSDWPHENKIQDFVNKYVSTRPCDDTIKLYYATLQKKSNISNVCRQTDYSNDSRIPFSVVSLSNLVSNIRELHTFARPDFIDIFRYEMDVPKTYYSIKNLADLNAKWVKDSFYRLNVYFRQSTVEQHTQVASFSFADMWSGVGGILGLWAGVSVMTLIEVFSFIVNFVKNCIKRDCHSNMTKVENIENNSRADDSVT